jgi:hypothetical protein
MQKASLSLTVGVDAIVLLDEDGTNVCSAISLDAPVRYLIEVKM